MDYLITAVVLVASLTSIPTTWFLTRIELMKDPKIAYPVYYLCWAAACALPIWFLRKRYRNVDCVIYVFPVLCWLSAMNLVVGLNQDGLVKGFMVAQLEEWEPVLNSSTGVVSLYWDGVVHYILQFSAVILFTTQDSYREVALYWSGSLLNSFLVIIYGNFIGTRSPQWTEVIGAVFIAIPIGVACKLLRDKPFQARSFRRAESVLKRPVDLIFVIFFILFLILTIFRGLTALGADVPCMRDYRIHFEPYIDDPSGYPKMQMVINLFYSAFYYLCVIDTLVNFTSPLWLADWSLIFAGSAAQSQFVYMASSIHPRTARNFRPPRSGLGAAVFWGFNLLLLIVPHLFAWRCWRDPDNCGRTNTVEVSRPVNRLSSKKSK